MERQYEKKIIWTIKNFSSLKSESIYYDNYFVVSDSKWRLQAYPKGCLEHKNKSLSLFMAVADFESLPYGWKRHSKFCLTVVNQIWEKLSQQRVIRNWFYQKSSSWGLSEVLPLTKLLDANGGFLVKGEVKIVVKVVVLEVIGKSDVLVETPLVESVNKLFNKHPDITSKFRLKNPHLRTTYMNSLLSLTGIMSQSPEELSNVDLANAYCTLSCLKKAGFKLDWLEKKLKEVGKTRLQQHEKELKEIKDLKEEFMMEF